MLNQENTSLEHAAESSADKTRMSLLDVWFGLGRGAKLVIKMLIGIYLIFCVLFLGLRFAVLPQIDRFKPDVESYASKALGRQVKITKLAASWDGLNPRLSLSEIAIHDLAGKVALSVPEVKATVSWWSVVFVDVRFVKLEVIKPSLDIARDAQGRLFVAGFFIDTEKKGDSKDLDWLLSQNLISIKGGALSWTDQRQEIPDLVLTEVDFVSSNHWRRHRFSLRARPPAMLSAPLDIRGDFQHPVFAKKISDVGNWSGELYASLQEADLAAIKNYVKYPLDLKSGRGAVQAWAVFEKGRVEDLTADVSLNDVVGKFRKDLPLLDMEHIKGRIMASEKVVTNHNYLPLQTVFQGQAGHSISLVDFAMQTRDGISLPATTIRENYYPAEKGKPEKVEFYAKLLDLQTLAHFAEHLPLPSDQRRILIEFAPKGQLKEFSGSWQGSYPEIAAYQIKGQFVNLAMNPLEAQLARPKSATQAARAAIPAIPGFENLTGSVDANDKGGRFEIESKDLTLQFPGYLVDPILPFNSLSMVAKWQFLPDDKLAFEVDKMAFEQEGLTASIAGKQVLSMRKQANGEVGEIDIKGNFTGFDLKKIKRYLPLSMKQDLREFLTKALLDGRLDDVNFLIKGELSQFPFGGKEVKPGTKGDFNVFGRIVDGRLNFSPDRFMEDGVTPTWPIIDAINGTILFDRAKLEVKADNASTKGLALTKVKALIPDLYGSNAILNVDGALGGGLNAMMQYVNASPIDGWVGHFLQEAKGVGNASMSLTMQMPLKNVDDTKVNGILQFANNEAMLQSDIPYITNLSGKLEFNERDINLNSMKASILGGPAQVSGGTQKDGSIRIKVDGYATADGIHKHFPSPKAEKYVNRVTGATKFSTVVNVRKQKVDLLIESSLQGLGLDFPAPLHKAAGEVMPLRFELLPSAISDANAVHEDLKINLGSSLQARYHRQKSNEKNAPWRMTRGGIGVNAPPPEPDSGLYANVEYKAINVDDWRLLIAEGNDANASSSAPPSTSSGQDIAAYVELNAIALRTPELTVLGKKLQNALAGATHQKGAWHINLDADQASGYVNIAETKNAQDLGHISARLSRLYIPTAAAADVSDLIEGKNTAAQIPSLDIVAEHFELFDKKWGQLELTASNQIIGGARDWRISKLWLKNDDAELKASGRWSNRTGEGISSVNYELELADAGKFLERAGFSKVLRGGKGKLEGEIKWNGLPFAIDFPSVAGDLKLQMSAGQFLKVEPGVGKLLGVLSLQSLPRRLTLDFRDLFSDGFAFDSITASAQIQHGILRTDNFKMNSVSATVLMDGIADLDKETQNFHVAVIPEINAGTASVVYALAVNPVIGLGTFLAQLFLRAPLARAFTYEYDVTGDWAKPIVTKVENREVKPETKEVPATEAAVK